MSGPAHGHAHAFGDFRAREREGLVVAGRRGMLKASLAGLAGLSLPDLIRLEAFSVAGPARRFDGATKSEIPQLWAALVGALPLKGQSPSWATYGVVWSADRETGSFQYMAGVGAGPDCELPKGFTVKQIPAATYVVFRIALNGSALHPQVKSAMATIWGELIPASGLRVADSPDFELYDGQFAPDQPGAVIDFHVPVEV